MNAYRHILFPTDGTRLSGKALKAAIALARLTRARITALNVTAPYMPAAYVDAFIPEPPGYTQAEHRKATRAAAERLLGMVEKSARTARVRCDTIHAEDASPWRAILRTARSRGCDLIVMASHGRRGIEALVLGSETNKVLTHSRVPVMVCR